MALISIKRRSRFAKETFVYDVFQVPFLHIRSSVGDRQKVSSARRAGQQPVRGAPEIRQRLRYRLERDADIQTDSAVRRAHGTGTGRYTTVYLSSVTVAKLIFLIESSASRSSGPCRVTRYSVSRTDINDNEFPLSVGARVSECHQGNVRQLCSDALVQRQSTPRQVIAHDFTRSD